jgi:hypothetical protein
VSVPPIYLAPDVWRRFMRDETAARGWSRRRMRVWLRAAGVVLDPWKVPLPVMQPSHDGSWSALWRPGMEPNSSRLAGLP